MLSELFSCATLGSDYSTRPHANAQHMSGTPFQRSNPVMKGSEASFPPFVPARGSVLIVVEVFPCPVYESSS